MLFIYYFNSCSSSLGYSWGTTAAELAVISLTDEGATGDVMRHAYHDHTCILQLSVFYYHGIRLVLTLISC